MRIRTLILSVIWILVSACASAQAYWTGAGDGTSWNDAANWSAGAVPVATDDVILDNSTIATSYAIILPAGTTSTTLNSLLITPLAGNTIQLTIPAGNTAATALIISFVGDGMILGQGASFINASAADIEIDGNLVIQPGGTINLSPGANSPVLNVKGNITITGPVAAGGAITETGTGNPVIELNGNNNQRVRSTTGAITGDNLDFVVNTTGTVTLISNIQLPHNLTVQAGTLDIAALAIDHTLAIKGDLVINGTITESGTSSLSNILLNGTAVQHIQVAGAGSIAGDEMDFRLNNPAGAVLLSDVVLPFQYSIVSGNLTLGNFSLTTPFVLQVGLPQTNHIITNGAGFLIIPNVGAGLYIFPIGIDAFSVNQVEISNGSGLTYSIRVDPGVNPTITIPFAAINRTWTIKTNSVAANPVPANVTFYYYTGQEGAEFDFGSTVDIGQFIPNAWNIVRNGLTPTSNAPEYRAYAAINSFNTPFIVGNHGAILPIDFSIVNKVQKKDNSAIVNWTVYTLGDSVLRYDVEQSVNGSNFKSIETVTAGYYKTSYSYTDKNLAGGTTVYRIKVSLFDGRIRFSNTVAVLYNTKSLLITSIAPNPATTDAKMIISSPGNTSVRLIVYDAQGKIVNQWQQAISDGTNVIPVHVNNLKAGLYFISATDGQIKTNTVRLVKQ